MPFVGVKLELPHTFHGTAGRTLKTYHAYRHNRHPLVSAVRAASFAGTVRHRLFSLELHYVTHEFTGTIGRIPSSNSVCPADVVTEQDSRYITPRVPAVIFCVTFDPEMEALPEMTALGLASVPE